MKVKSREYKVMVDHRLFVGERRAAIDEFWADVKRAADRCGVTAEGRFDEVVKQVLQFYDTDNYTLRSNRLILRMRQQKGDTHSREFTLKRRTEDRYMSEGVDLRPAKPLKSEQKFEEDIGPPFCSRFSHSSTIKRAEADPPKTISEAAELFPVIGEITCNGRSCDPHTPLTVVNGLTAHERVLKGPTFSAASGASTSVALIFWSYTWKGRIISAEFSSRYGNDDEDYSHAGVETAFKLFAEVQKLDWCLPGAKTKTQFAYGDE